LRLDASHPLGKLFAVYLNGVRISNCKFADEYEGKITVFDYEAQKYRSFYGKVELKRVVV